MTPEQVVRTYFIGWASGDRDALADVLAEDVVAQGPLATVSGRLAHAESLANSSSLFKTIDVVRLVVDGQDVLTWFTLYMTTGEELAAANWCRVESGRITAVRVVFDPRSLLRSRTASAQ
jgi:ketosteroid isomerase-like protein